MMSNVEMLKTISRLAEKDTRYRKEAYLFVLAGLEFTVEKLQEVRHLSGQELALGIAEYARTQYGYMAQTVLEYWGIKQTHDFGEIVFNLIQEGLMRKAEEDHKEDFDGVYEFSTEFTWDKTKPTQFPERFE
jgi:uncharacterized repeat protein (TIGR04138 family)